MASVSANSGSNGGSNGGGSSGAGGEKENKEKKLVLVMRASYGGGVGGFDEEKACFDALLGDKGGDYEVWPLMDVVKGRAWAYTEEQEQLLRDGQVDQDPMLSGINVLFYSMCKAANAGSPNQRRLTPTPANDDDAEFGVALSNDIDVTEVVLSGDLSARTGIEIGRMCFGKAAAEVAQEHEPASVAAASQRIGSAADSGRLLFVQRTEDEGRCTGIVVVPGADERDDILAELQLRKIERDREIEEQEDDNDDEKIVGPERVLATTVRFSVRTLDKDNQETFENDFAGEERVNIKWPESADDINKCPIVIAEMEKLLALVQYPGNLVRIVAVALPKGGNDGEGSDVQQVTIYAQRAAVPELDRTLVVDDDEAARLDFPFPEQQEMAELLLLKAAACLVGDNGGGDGGEEDGAHGAAVEAALKLLGDRYDDVRFSILVPNFKSLQTQTQERVLAADIGTGEVLRFCMDDVAKREMAELVEAAKRPKTLVVLVADECHNAPTLGGAHDKLLNNEGLQGPNVLKLLVSATPQNCLSQTSRVHEHNIVCWNKPVTLYRSMQYYIETMTWAAPPQVKLWVAGEPLFGLEGYRFAPGGLKGLAEVLNLKVAKEWPKTNEMRNRGPTFEVVPSEEKGEAPRLLRVNLGKRIELDSLNFDPKVGLLAWLGFTSDGWGAELRNGTHLRRVKAAHVHRLDHVDGEHHGGVEGVAEGADCLPRKSQRVCEDDTFGTLLSAYRGTFGKRKGKAGKTRTGDNKVSENTPLFDGHFLLVDYLISFAFMAVYRVRRTDEEKGDGDGEGTRVDIRAARDSGSLLLDLSRDESSPSTLCEDSKFANQRGVERLDAFAAAVGFNFNDGGFNASNRAANRVDAARDKSVMHFRCENGEEGTVQHVADRALAAMEATAGKEWASSDPGKAWVESAKGEGQPTNFKDARVRREVWRYIIREKLEANEKEMSETPTNSSEAWFTDTDRIVQNLLDVHPETYTGRMCVVRVYEKDENMSIQDALRGAMVKLGLEIAEAGKGKSKKKASRRTVISVVGDVGGTEKRFTSADGTAFVGTSLYSQLEPWALEADLRDHDDAGRRTKPPVTVHSISQARAARASSDNIADGKVGKTRRRGILSATYADLNNLPVIVVLCDKGRMGDTFPETFRYLDLRLRASDVYSSFVQEFGRVCRYPKLLDDTQEFVAAGVQQQASPEDEARMKELLREKPGAGGKSLVQHFTSGSSVVVEDPDGNLAFHADSPGQLRERLLRGLAAAPAGGGAWVIKRYKHCLPTVLVPETRFASLADAVELKYVAGEGKHDVADCIKGRIDSYVFCDKGHGTEVKGETNNLHSLKAYLTRTKVTTTNSSKKRHYDDANASKDDQRLLLKAQCQQGKTGCYLHLIRLLVEAVQPLPLGPMLLEPNLEPRKWEYPSWQAIAGEDPMPYDKPHVGQYHQRVMLQRLQALHLSARAPPTSSYSAESSSSSSSSSSSNGNGNGSGSNGNGNGSGTSTSRSWVEEYVNDYLLHHGGEGIASAKGIAKAQGLLETYQLRAHPTTGTTGITGADEDVVWGCVNFDKRMYEEELKVALIDLLRTPAFLEGIPRRGTLGLAESVSVVVRSMWAKPAPSQDADARSAGAGAGPGLSAGNNDVDEGRRVAILEVAAAAAGPALRVGYCKKPDCHKDLRCDFSGFPFPKDSKTDVSAVSISLSLPRGGFFAGGRLQDLFDIEDKTLRGLTAAGRGLKWVFVPSYKRAGDALLDFSKAVSDEQRKSRVFVIVVRAGSEFDAYVRHYGSLHVILGMPAELPAARATVAPGAPQAPGGQAPVWSSATVTAASSGIGFSRYFVQVFASTLKLKWVWMLDDGVFACFERNLAAVEAEAPRPCRFDEVMERIEAMMAGPLLEPVGVNVDGADKIKPPEALIRCKDPRPDAGNPAATKVDVMGGDPGSKYGLVGIRRCDARRTEEHILPFTVTYSVYSFVYINIEATVAKGVIYPPKVFMEDIEFNHLVEESGLVCLKANQYYHNKKFLKHRIRRLPPSARQLCDALGDKKPLRWQQPPSSMMTGTCADADLWAERVHAELDGDLFVASSEKTSTLCFFLERSTGEGAKGRNDAGARRLAEAEVVVIVYRTKDEGPTEDNAPLVLIIAGYDKQPATCVTHDDLDLKMVVFEKVGDSGEEPKVVKESGEEAMDVEKSDGQAKVVKESGGGGGDREGQWRGGHGRGGQWRGQGRGAQWERGRGRDGPGGRQEGAREELHLHHK